MRRCANIRQFLELDSSSFIEENYWDMLRAYTDRFLSLIAQASLRIGMGKSRHFCSRFLELDSSSFIEDVFLVLRSCCNSTFLELDSSSFIED